MKNIDIKVTGEKMVITVDLNKTYRRSASGKSIIIASIEGNERVNDVSVGVNVYKKG